jgi:4-amino-4-deoxy-L-arabinose transferase-like glycosyltransferase
MLYGIKINRKQTLLFLTLFLIAFLPRIYHLEDSFLWDQEQGVVFWTIKKIVVEKKLPLVGQHFLNQETPVFRPPFFAYFSAVPLLLTQNNPLSIEFCLAVIGALTATLIFWVTKKLFDQKAAFFAFLGYAFSSFVIGADKNLVPPTMLILSSLLFLSFLLNALKQTRNQRHFLAIGLLIGLMFSFHFSAIIALISVFSVFLIFKKEFKLNFKKILIFLSAVFIMLLPVLVFNARHGFLMIDGFKKIVFGKSFNIPIGISASLILALSTINRLNLSLPSINLNINLTFFSLILWLVPILFIVKLKKTRPQKVFFLILLILLVFSFLFLYLVGNPFYQMTHYLLFLIPFFFIVWGGFFSQVSQVPVGKIVVVLIFSLFLFQNTKVILTLHKGSYIQKIELVNQILKKTKPDKVTNIKFLDQDYTPFDFLVYYRAPFYGLKYENINLIQTWTDTIPDIVVKKEESKLSIILNNK